MAQQFQVVRCCFCHVFQAQQVKKSTKWNCKICNEKQSVLKIFGQGSGSDCRHHVQKLNLFQGEQEQASLNMPWHTEKPEKRDDKNTVAQLEETLDGQTRPIGEEKISHWNKYLDRSCEEEKMLHTEKHNYSLKNTAKDPRKRKKTSFGSSDAQKSEENRVSGFGKNHRRNSFRDSQACENAAHESMEILASEELLVHGKSEEARLKKAALSDQKKTLSTETVLECQGPVIQRSSAAGCDEIIANFIDSPTNRQHIQRQTASAFIDEGRKDNEHIEEANILTGKNKNTSVLASANCLQMLPKETASIPSIHPLAFSSAPGRYSSLFATGDDFDDYL